MYQMTPKVQQENINDIVQCHFFKYTFRWCHVTEQYCIQWPLASYLELPVEDVY